MSDQSTPGGGITLNVEGPNPAAELAIYDHLFVLRESGIGKIEAHLPAGLYDLEASIANRRERKTFALSGPLTIGANDWSLQVRTTAPLAPSKPADSLHEEMAVRHSRAPTLKAGELAGESRLFIFLRRLKRSGDGSRSAAEQFWSGFRLSTADGRSISDFSAGVEGDAENGWCALTVDLAEGGYVLSGPGATDRELCMALWVQPHFETHVFIPVDGRPNFDSATLSMAPKNAGFVLGKQNETEYAAALLAGFRRGKDLMNAALVRDMLQSKFYNPFCGIVAAHALLRAAKPDRALLQEVIGNLRGMLGNHPDVIALELIAKLRSDVVLAFPPVLRLGFEGVLARSASEPELIDVTPIISEVLGGMLPAQYTLWQRATPASWKPFAAAVGWVQTAIAAAPSFFGSLQRGEVRMVGVDLGKVIDSFESWLKVRKTEELARQLGLPRSIVDRVMGQIVELLPKAREVAAGPIGNLKLPIGVTDHLAAVFFEYVTKALATSKLSPLDRRVIQLIVQFWKNSGEGRETTLEAAQCRRRLILIAGTVGKARDLLPSAASERDDASVINATLAGLAARLYPFLIVGRGLDIILASGWCAQAARDAKFAGPAGASPLGPPLERMLTELLFGAGFLSSPKAEDFVPITVHTSITLGFLRLEQNYWAAGIDIATSPLAGNVDPEIAKPSEEWIDRRLIALTGKIEPVAARLLELVRDALDPLGPTRPALENLPEAVRSFRTALQQLMSDERA